jgi:hypothetical protein
VIVAGMRILLGSFMAIAWVTVKPYLALDQLTGPKYYAAVVMPRGFPADAWLGVWVRWDAVHYLNLAVVGYTGVSAGDSIFYPLYSGLVNLISRVLAGNILLAGLTLSTLSAVLAFAFLHRMTEELFGEETARWSIVALACFPTAFFLIAPFTESLFLALTLGAFLCAYRGRWWLAGILGCVASFTRGPGMFTGLALAALALASWRNAEKETRRQQWIAWCGGVFLPIAGGLAFLFWRSAMGYPSVTDILQRYSGLVMTDPVSGLWTSLLHAPQKWEVSTVLEIVCAFFFLAMTGAMILRKRWRRPEWIVYTAANLLFFLSKQSFTASSLQSLPRYVLVLFPVFIMIGGWLADRDRIVKFIFILISSCCAIALSVLYTFWIFIG